MAKEFKITSLRLADLEKELNYLKTTREREVAAMIAEARSYGDLSENSEYDAAKNEQAKLYGRIAEIEDILSHAVIIEDENEATGRVGLCGDLQRGVGAPVGPGHRPGAGGGQPVAGGAPEAEGGGGHRGGLVPVPAGQGAR